MSNVYRLDSNVGNSSYVGQQSPQTVTYVQQPVVQQQQVVVTNTIPAKYIVTPRQKYTVDNRNIMPVWLKCCIWLLPLIFALYCIIVASFVINGALSVDNDVPYAAGVLESIQANLDKDPITSVISVDAGTDCDTGASKAVLGNWPGIDSGCLCTTGDDEGVHDTAFCYVSFDDDCYVVDDVDAREITSWQVGGIETEFCITTNEDWYHVAGSECNDGYTLCQSSICVADTEDCPLNAVACTENSRRNLFESHSVSSDPILNTHVSQSNTLLFDFATCVFTAEVGTSEAIVGFGVVPGSTPAPCWNEKYSLPYDSELYYPLLSVPAQGCGVEYGARAVPDTEADMLLATTIYVDNGIYNTDLTTLAILDEDVPSYALYADSNDNVALYVDTRVPVSEDEGCADVESALFTDCYENSSELSTTEHVLAWLIIVLAIITIVLTFYYLLMKKQQAIPLNGQQIGYTTDVNPLSNDPKHKQQTALLYILAYLLVIFCVMAAIVFWVYKEMSGGLDDNYDDLQNLVDSSCFDDTKPILACQESLDYIEGSYTWLTSPILALFYGAVGFLIISVIILIYRKHTYPYDMIHLVFVNYYDSRGQQQSVELIANNLTGSGLNY